MSEDLAEQSLAESAEGFRETIKVEVYVYPEDCLSEELLDYFTEDAVVADCLTPENQIWNNKTKTFVLEFNGTDAETILSQHEWYLDKDEEESKVLVRRFFPPTRQVLLTIDKDVNARILKKHFSQQFDVESCVPADDSKKRFILTLVNTEDAEKLAAEGRVSLSSGVELTTELYLQGSQRPFTARAFTQSFRSDTPTYDGRSDSPIDFHDQNSPLDATSHSTPKHGSRQFHKQGDWLEHEGTDLTDSVRTSTDAGDNIPPDDDPEESPTYTHVEIDKLKDEPTQDMFSMLELHFDTCLESGHSPTKFEQSYDKAKNVFRFDLRPQDIKRLLSAKQLIFEEDEDTALTIRPLSSQKCVRLKVMPSPEKSHLTESKLREHFGENGPFKSKLSVLFCKRLKATIEMETCSVASLVVSLGRHTLENKVVLQAEFLQTIEKSDADQEISPKTFVVVETRLQKNLLDKFLRAKYKGKITDEQLGENKYLVEFENEDHAGIVLNKETIDYRSEKLVFNLYEPDDEYDEDDTDSSSESGSEDSNIPTYIEVQKLRKGKSKELYGQIISAFDEVLGEGSTSTIYEHSYDEKEKVFRFDMKPRDISKFSSQKRLLSKDKKSTELVMRTGVTGRRLVIRLVAADQKKRWKKKDILAYFGPDSTFASNIEVVKLTDSEAEIEFDSCSVACRVVSHGQHELRRGMLVDASFAAAAEPESSSSDEDSKSSGDSDDARYGESKQRSARLRSNRKVPESRTLVISDLLDVDEQTVYFWVKSLIKIWPQSVQLSADGERAAVKIPGNCEIDADLLQAAPCSSDFLLHEETLTVTEARSTTKLQVICSSDKPGFIERDTLEAYFTNPKYTGVQDTEALQGLKEEKNDVHGRQVFILTYSSSQDLESILQKRPHKSGKWNFDAVEYCSEIGICKDDSLVMFTMPQIAEVKTEQAPTLYISDVDEDDVETLEMFMSNRKRVGGSEVKSCQYIPGEQVVRLVYEDPKAAERVYYEFYTKKGIVFKKKQLDIELELPWLSEHHDHHRVRLSGLSDGLDPAKLKFYLSAISDNLVTQIFFNQEQTRAIAVLRDPLDYGQLLHRCHTIPLDDCPRLKVTQDPVGTELVAVGKLSKEDIELHLETKLRRQFHRDMDVHAEEIESAVDTWKIKTEPEALPYLLSLKNWFRGCSQLSVYSDYLGLQETSGVQRKTQELRNFVSHPLMLEFLLNPARPGFQKLIQIYKQQHLVLSEDGIISMDPASTADRQKLKTMMKNWRALKLTTEKIVSENFSVYSTDALTQQVFLRVDARLAELLTNQPVETRITKATNQISIAGEKIIVDDLKRKILELIGMFEKQIQEEKTITQSTVPNILDFQIRYLESIGFADEMKKSYKVNQIALSSKDQNVTIHGVPSDINAVQKEMLSLLPQISASKVTDVKKPLFFKVFATEFAQREIENKLRSEQIKMVWNIEHKTLSIYSGTQRQAQKALDIINELIWETQHPPNEEFDELERELLVSGLWKDTKDTMQELYKPLEIAERDDKTCLILVGLANHRDRVMEAIPAFFEENVERVKQFKGNPDRILFLTTIQPNVLRDLQRDHGVALNKGDNGMSIEVVGTRDKIANCDRSLKKAHDAISKDTHVIESQAEIQHIKDEPDFLQAVGLKTGCLVVAHRPELFVPDEEEMPLPQSFNNKPGITTIYSVTLPSGIVCKVQKGDITALSCDAIVNAANGDLNHVGGLAAAVVRKGGDSIQRECSNYVRKEGKLMDGQVMTSSPGALACRKIIHAVGPRWNNGRSGEERTMFNCIDNVFEEADEHQLQSVAIPPISTGIFGYPVKEAVITIVEALAHRVTQNQNLPREVIFIDNKDDSLALFKTELDSRYGRSKPKSKGKSKKFSSPVTHSLTTPAMRPIIPKSVQGPAVRYTVSGKIVTVWNRVTVEIVVGDLAASEEDSLVSSVGADLNLANGKASAALLKRAGAPLQTECSKLVPIKPGEVKMTGGYQLFCKKVLHCCCPSWNGPACLPALADIVTKCLTTAASNAHVSIAFPALGTGNHGYPEKEVAQTMMETFMAYVEKHPASSVTDIKVVMFHLDAKTREGFDAELTRLIAAAPISTPVLAPATSSDPPEKRVSPKQLRKRDLKPLDEKSFSHWKSEPRGSISSGGLPDSLTPDAIKGCVTVNNATIRIIRGDITAHTAGALVNSTDQFLSIQGEVSRAIMAKAGQTVTNEVDAHRLSKTPSDGGLWVTEAGDLNAHYIFHVDAQRGSEDWAKLISHCLRECDKREVQSIAFPALGTGGMGKTPKDMAKITLEAAVKYLDENSRSIVETIDVVIFKESMVKDFVQSMSKSIQSKDSWWKRVGATVSQLFSPITGLGNSVSAKGDYVAGNASGAQQVKSEDTELKLDIYARTSSDIQKCKRELDTKLDKVTMTMFWKDRASYESDRELIRELSREQNSDLQAEAQRLHISALHIDTRLLDIKITGRTKEVYELAEIVASELKKIERYWNEKKEEELVAAIRQWEYTDEQEQWAKFTPSLNKQLEDLYNKDAQGSLPFSTADGKVVIDLGKMEGKRGNEVFKVRRIDLSQPQAAVLNLPSTWASPFDIYSEITLVAGTPEYNDVETVFMKTLGAKGNGVIEIKRVQNPVAYQQYTLLRQGVAKKLGKKEDQVEIFPLWHGTDELTVSKITSGKFDRALSGKNATVHGSGSYFARNSSYSAQGYAQPNASGHKYIIYTRVVTGEWCQGANGMLTAPYKPNSPTEQYDSVVDNVANPSMYIVFHDTAAYPEYIIKFT